MGKTPVTKLAQVAVKYAVDNGKLVKPDNCEKCGKAPKTLHGHHKNYNKPLEVIWLCPACHRAEHGKITGLKSPTGNRFQKERMKLFATHQEAAKAMGVTPGAICHWERGIRPVPDYAWILLGYIEREQEAV